MDYGKIRPEGYMPRIADESLREMLGEFGAVEVSGMMWCGKTWTSLAFGESVTRLGQTAVRSAVEADPQLALVGDRPHVIDEWQDVPDVWDEVRAAVDAADGEAGQFILTGSSMPMRTQTHHSGAGRIGRLRMRTMSLYETGESEGEISLSGLFDGRFTSVQVQQKLEPLAEIICRGGWPSLIRKSAKNPSRVIDSYFDALFDVNIPRRKMDGGEARRVMTSLARNQGNAVKLRTVAADAQFDDITDKAADTKAAAYISALKDLYVLEELSGWDAPVRSGSRVRTKAKYYLSDPSMAATLLQLTPQRLLGDGQTFGILFEALCIHDLLVYASAMPEAQTQPLKYYRDSDGLETDAIIELRDGRWAAIEIKLGENKVGEAAASLNRLRRKVTANPAARNPKPEFAAVIVGAGEFARYDKENDVYIIPITALGP